MILLSMVVLAGAAGCSGESFGAVCGNGHLDLQELCDDGNTADGDGCSADCQSDESCGNWIVDDAVGEACDDGNALSGDGCQEDCVLPTCGDGFVDVGELCDDGALSGMGEGTCLSDCAGFQQCGNGVTEGTEFCDDGLANGVGEGVCLVDCSARQTCGDGVVEGSEGCDEAHTDFGPCLATCVSNPINSYGVNTGPAWGTNPATYTCQEACALLFGGIASDYHCSVDSSTLTNTAWASGYADSSHCGGGTPVSDDYKLGATYDCGSFGCSYSAYVQDVCWSTPSINYCWYR